MDDIEIRVRKLVVVWFGVEECDIWLDSDFCNDFGVELFEVVELVMVLEVEFGVEIVDDDVEWIEIVCQVIDYFEEVVLI